MTPPSPPSLPRSPRWPPGTHRHQHCPACSLVLGGAGPLPGCGCREGRLSMRGRVLPPTALPAPARAPQGQLLSPVESDVDVPAAGGSAQAGRGQGLLGPWEPLLGTRLEGPVGGWPQASQAVLCHSPPSLRRPVSSWHGRAERGPALCDHGPRVCEEQLRHTCLLCAVSHPGPHTNANPGLELSKFLWGLGLYVVVSSESICVRLEMEEAENR